MNNRKNITGMICFFIVLLFANISFSQFKNFGIKAGLNLSGARIDYIFNIAQPINKIGFNAGLFYDFLNLHNFIISSEAGFSSRGYKDKIIVTDEFGNELDRFNITNSLNYIDISVLGKYIFTNKSVSPYISLGPVLAFYTGYSVSVPKDKGQFIIAAENNALLDTLDKTTFGIKGGIGIEIKKIVPQTLIAEVRYYMDLKNSFSNNFVTFKRNMMWELNLGIKF